MKIIEKIPVINKFVSLKSEFFFFHKWNTFLITTLKQKKKKKKQKKNGGLVRVRVELTTYQHHALPTELTDQAHANSKFWPVTI